MAYKVFSNGNTLPASDLNTYLMNQSVMTFASSTARSAALTSPTEGMLTWLEDSNKYQSYNGTSWVDLIADSVYTQAGKNVVINGAFDIWQRGTSATAIGSGTFLADRWQAVRSGFAAGSTQSRQATSDTTNLPDITYCLRVQRDSGNTSTAIIYVGQNLESVNSTQFAGKTITLSFYARKGANFSQTSSQIATALASGTGTDQNLVTSGTLTGIDNTITSHTLTTTWQRFTVTKVVSASATQLALEFYYAPTGTAGAADYFEITAVQLEVGSVATPFSRNASSIQGELAACQRYYVRYNAASNVYAGLAPSGFIQSSTVAMTHVQFPVEMRISPTAIDYSTVQIIDANTSTFTPSALTISGWTTAKLGGIEAAISGGTAGRFALLRANNSTSAYVGFSAEL